MLRSVKSMNGYVFAARDGEVGRCKDFLFDDRDWVVRYLVADTGGWLAERRVLISPLALRKPDWQTRRFPVTMTRREIEDSPPLDTHAPVSRQYEIAYHRHFSFPFYWSGPELWDGYADPGGVPHPAPGEPQAPAADLEIREGHLRSCAEVADYRIRATDGEHENLSDFIVDDRNWAIRFLVVDTRRWLPGGQVLVPAACIASVDWADSEVRCELDVAEIRNSPAYDPRQPVNVEYEKQLYDYYGRPKP
jgi:hypothetical protein